MHAFFSRKLGCPYDVYLQVCSYVISLETASFSYRQGNKKRPRRVAPRSLKPDFF